MERRLIEPQHMVLPQVLQVRGNYGLVYTDQSYLPRRKSSVSLIENIGSAKTYSGKITSSSAKRIRKTVSCFIQKSKKRTIFNTVTNKSQVFQVSFLTLTIPDLTTNNNSFYYKRLLKPFLRILKERYQLKEYIWKAELQKRGSIHYHLTLNEFIPITSIKNEWNKLLQKENLMSSYIRDFNNVSPNSVDIHSVKDVENIEAYLCKYISKIETGKQALIGKVWGCSESLQGIKYFSETVVYELESRIMKLVDSGKVVLKHFDNFKILRFTGKVNWSLFGTIFYNGYNEWRYNQPVLRL